MTNAEAIKWFRENPFYHKDHVPFNMAIKALEQEPCNKCVYSTKDGCCQYDDITETIPPFEPSGDLISREAVLENAFKIYTYECGLLEVVGVATIKTLPSVKPQEPKTGHWIDIMVGDMPAQACDQCKTFYPLAYTGGGHKYCPNCGAKMESEG